MQFSKTRQKLIDMYISALKENKIPWKERWNTTNNYNYTTGKEYRGINRLLLSYVSSTEKYNDPRWCTFVQIKEKGWKLSKEAKGKGVPIEFWSCYNIKTKERMDFVEYYKYIEKFPEEKDNFKIFVRNSYVYNAKYIDGIPKYEKIYNKKINIPKYIKNVINNIGVCYEEHGNEAYYDPKCDKVVLPPSEKFKDRYSYYATQLHELSHATGSKNRLDRNLDNKNIKEYAREELVAEISSSFLMQDLEIPASAEHYDNHKSYIQSWIKIFENDPHELFNAISKANEACEYIESNSKDLRKEKDYVR